MNVEDIQEEFSDLVAEKQYFSAWCMLRNKIILSDSGSQIDNRLLFNIISEMIHWGDITAISIILGFNLDLNIIIDGKGIFNEIIDAYYHKQDEMAIIALVEIFRENGLLFDYSVNMGWYPFQWCAARGYSFVLQYFLREGLVSDINIICVDADIKCTALRLAFDLKEYDCVKILVEYGANPLVDIVGYKFYNGLYFSDNSEFMDYLSKVSHGYYARLPKEWSLTRKIRTIS